MHTSAAALPSESGLKFRSNHALLVDLLFLPHSCISTCDFCNTYIVRLSVNEGGTDVLVCGAVFAFAGQDDGGVSECRVARDGASQIIHRFSVRSTVGWFRACGLCEVDEVHTDGSLNQHASVCVRVLADATPRQQHPSPQAARFAPAALNVGALLWVADTLRP
jgi:hypothetical protein